jgi:hypothetical protein
MEILFNPLLSTNTESITVTGSSLSYKNGYYFNSEIGRGDLTSEFNVQEFLNNPNNIIIVDNFLEYIKYNFTQPQILTLYNNNLSLSNAINGYYNTLVRNNISIPNLIIPANANYSASTVSYAVNGFDANKHPVKINKTGTSYTFSADSYYVNIYISSGNQPINNASQELSKTSSSGLTVVKNVSYVENLYLSGTPTTKRVVSLSDQPYLLLNGFVFPNNYDSPFGDFNNNGIDFDVSSFDNKNVFEIDAEVTGSTAFSETIQPKGTVDVPIGGSQTFIFRTIDSKKQIDKVFVDGKAVGYDRYNNESKQIVGSYTFTSVTQNHSIYVSFA